ncbi:DUF262 domain-containing protein [Laspinema sp. A4]|uniref:DUF262 domain-containing protein n=1 Tax=Laspinema sp. D2d TaxID=2953686 RepID=UPI0021BA3E73|nr:DUF262 domain-containing protein [Laspinema sp. D2d]MCT7986462.1 DUF262 domain-containing protein [Laspinema sp. D2d]
MSEIIVTQERKHRAEQQIRQEQKQVNYRTLDYPIAMLVDKYLTGIADNSNELFIPDYRQEMTWDEKRQSKFIELILLDFQIPSLYVSEVLAENETEDIRLEIVDGSQRLQTLARFLQNQLTLCNLTLLTELNGTRFLNLSDAHQNKFKRQRIRVVQFNPDTTKEDRRDFYERFNS